ncbi:hypothetical protein [Lichenihabitans psoromatis]|uniref:hypothetical protein n=1 Tax=Lichenihabitans psoromatis TaxID=2528642 RepID=UPI0013F1763A|nr:hypothetical protein [Lichenihabitans psoromatis]
MANVTGKFYEARKEKDGKYREQAALDELEKLLDKKTGARSSVADGNPVRAAAVL